APGPLVVLLPVRGPPEAVAVASALPRTAAAAVWAQDITAALDTADSPLVAAGDPEDDPELAQAVAAARGAAPRWGRLPGASRARVLRAAAAALGAGPGTPEDPQDGDNGDTERSLQGALLRWAAHVERVGGAVQVGVV
ncbi:hypothetical protein HGM15179_022144, partial [Zosterops borbonicus]